MADMTVSGTEADGVYTDLGAIYGTKNYYEKLPTDSMYYIGEWIIDRNGTVLYSAAEDVATPDLVSSWTVVNGTGYPTVSAGASPPTVTTSAVSSIGTNAATGNGNVTSNGGASVTERGVVANTSTNPTTSHLKFTSGTGTGVFTASMTGLTPGTLYYVRAYAINSAGTSYGSNVTFTTDSAGGVNSGFFGLMREKYNGLKDHWKQSKGGLWVPECGY